MSGGTSTGGGGLSNPQLLQQVSRKNIISSISVPLEAFQTPQYFVDAKALNVKSVSSLFPSVVLTSYSHSWKHYFPMHQLLLLPVRLFSNARSYVARVYRQYIEDEGIHTI